MSEAETIAVAKWMKRKGVKEKALPPILRDGIVISSRSGPVGKVVVKNLSGLVSNVASRTLKQFEENVGGKEEVAEKLSLLPDLPEDLARLVSLIGAGSKKGLATLVAEARTEPTAVMRAYARGCMELGLVQSAIEMHHALPRAVKDIVLHAIDREDICEVCAGSGRTKTRPNHLTEDQVCPGCRGSGRKVTSSKHKEFAMGKLLEMTKMVEKGGVRVEVNNQTAVLNGKATAVGGMMEKMLLATDAILNPAPSRAALPPAPSGDVVDAEEI